MAHRSTMSTLIQVVDDWASALDHGYLNFIIIREVDIITHVTEKTRMHETNLEDEGLREGGGESVSVRETEVEQERGRGRERERERENLSHL